MEQTNGLKQQKDLLVDKENNAVSVGLIIQIQLLKKLLGKIKKNGIYFYFIKLQGRNGQSTLKSLMEELITRLKITGIVVCKKRQKGYYKGF